MRLCCITTLIFLQFAVSQGLKMAAIASAAFDIITFGIDFIDKLSSGDDFNQIQESINNLQSSVNEIHNKLDYVTSLVEKLIDLINEQPYKISLSSNIEKIKSCKIDLDNFLQRPTNNAARENFRKCYDIMVNVRAIASYLSGGSIVGLPPLFELYRHREGFYKGSTIRTVFQYLYKHFIDGCAIVVTAERDKFHQSSTLYKTECQSSVQKINSYMKEFYRKCIRETCPHFLHQAQLLLGEPNIVDVSSAQKTLEDNYPWFQSLIIQTTSTSSIPENKGTFSLKSTTFQLPNIYQVFWTDSFVLFDTKKSEIPYFNVTVKRSIYSHSAYGMNLQKIVEGQLVTFVGYTSSTPIDTCNYETGIFSSSALSSNKYSMTFNFAIVILFSVWYNSQSIFI